QGLGAVVIERAPGPARDDSPPQQARPLPRLRQPGPPGRDRRSGEDPADRTQRGGQIHTAGSDHGRIRCADAAGPADRRALRQPGDQGVRTVCPPRPAVPSAGGADGHGGDPIRQPPSGPAPRPRGARGHGAARKTDRTALRDSVRRRTLPRGTGRRAAAGTGPQLLILDEPGNNLDLSSLEALVTGLEGFGGAMIVITHDDRLAAELGAETEWDVREFLRAEAVGLST